MATIGIIILVIGLICLFFGIFVGAMKFLLYVGIALIVIGIIAALMRFIRKQT